MALRWLNIGCGHSYRHGWINLDYHSGNIEVQANLENGLPFKDGTIDYVYASHVLQHVRAPADLVTDIHRVLRTGGILEVFVPYGVVQSPYLRAFFPNTMDSFVKTRSMLSRSDFQLPSKPLFKKLLQETTGPLWRRKEIHWILEAV